METSIAAMSMGMAMANVQNALSVSMMKKSLDASQANMETITKMMDSMPSPDGRGTVLDIRV